MRIVSKAAVLALLAVGIAGCTDSGNNEAAKESAPAPSQPSAQASAPHASQADQDFRIQLAETAYALKHWKTDGSHKIELSGKLVQGDQPVAGAILHVGSSIRDIETAEDGSFRFLFDQSLLGQTDVKIVSLDKATVGGQAISQEQSEKGKAASATINVYYPIEIIGVSANGKNADMVDVKGKLIADGDASVSYFQEDKFRISGTVKDADGKPVKGAVVWIDRDTGEGFAKSRPADENGYYEMFYLPEDDEDTNLTVTLNGVKYTLPEGRVYRFPDDTSINVDISLPKEGTVIVDKPPTLVSKTAAGALYEGLMVGLDVPDDVSYSVTVPDAEGNFTVTVPKTAWERNPTFFETKMSKFIDDELNSGDTVPSSFIETNGVLTRSIKAVAKAGV